MEIKENDLNESRNLSAPITPQTSCKILKCPECFNIPEIIGNYDGYYSFKCRNDHEQEYQLKELLNKCSTSEIFYKCSYGNETNIQNKYCDSKIKKFLILESSIQFIIMGL